MKKLVLFFIILLSVSALHSQEAGSLDLGFGEQGIAVYMIDYDYDKANDVKVQPDGKILVAGVSRQNGNYVIVLVRHNPDGSTDSSFGDGGFVTLTPVNVYGNYVMETQTLPDGSIIIAGYYYDSNNNDTEPMIGKLNADGSVDTSFGNDGFVFGNNADDAVAECGDVQADGKIVLGGYLNDKMCAFRYNADGSVDTSFGDNGKAVILLEDVFYSYAKDIVIQPDGKIILAGFYMNPEGVYECLIVRLNEDGTQDETFADNGILTYVVSEGHDFINGVGLQSDGKILVGGHYWISNLPTLQYGFMVNRINADGTLDTSYGENGIAKSPGFEGAENYVLDMKVSEDDKTYCAGYVSIEGQATVAAIFSFDNDGNPNSGFGDNGIVTTNVENRDLNLNSIDIQSDGKLVVAGIAYKDNSSDFIVARYISDIITDVNEIDAQQVTISVMPNPAIDFITVNFDNEESNTVIISDINGRIMMETNIASGEKINISNLPSGSYFVISLENKNVGRFIKK